MQNKLLIFSTSWCRPCQKLKKTLSSIENQENIIQYDVEFDRGKALEWEVDAVPTLILVNYKGQELSRLIGTQTREKLLELLNE